MVWVFTYRLGQKAERQNDSPEASDSNSRANKTDSRLRMYVKGANPLESVIFRGKPSDTLTYITLAQNLRESQRLQQLSVR